MGSIQGLQGAGAAPSYVAPKAQAAPVPKAEAQESAQVERTEAQRGTQEVGERPSAPAGNPAVGSKFSATA